MSLTSPVTGAAISGLTSPTYTLSSLATVERNQESYYVSALGGTQTDVDAHSMGKPFTITLVSPKAVKASSSIVNAGLVANAPKNVYTIRTRKGTSMNAYDARGISYIETNIAVCAGSQEHDLEDLKAAYSLHVGAITQLGDEFIAAVQNGIW